MRRKWSNTATRCLVVQAWSRFPDPSDGREEFRLSVSLLPRRFARSSTFSLMAQAYTEASIKTLSSLEHIRLRPGMYIGRLGNGGHAEDGIYVLLKETIDNSIDEFMMGQGRKIEVEVTERSVKVRDYGRGIPLGKLVDCVSIINTGAKYDSETFQKAVGLNGVGQGGECALHHVPRAGHARGRDEGGRLRAGQAQEPVARGENGRAQRHARGVHARRGALRQGLQVPPRI